MRNPLTQIAVLLVLAAIGVVLFSIFVNDLPKNLQVDFISEIKTETLIQDSIKQVKDSIYSDSISIIGKGQVELAGHLDAFFSGLDSLPLKAKSLHIAHFGDSQIEGDLLTSNLREAMQQKYGGSGVGWMPMTSIVAGYRNTLGHQFNDEWDVYDIQDNSSPYAVGPTGQVFIAKPGASATYTATKYPFNKAWIFAHPSSSGTIACTANGQKSTIQWPIQNKYYTPISNLKGKQISIQCNAGSPALYGINFENGHGCYVDNFAYRGSSGAGLSQLPKALFSSLEEIINYRLIILEFGLNVHSVGVSDYKKYASSFDKTIKHIKSCFPHASILVIGISDKGRKIKGQWESDVTVKELELAQRNAAQNNGCAFFSLYEAMGGEGSIVSWVEDSIPKLANNDYTHLSRDGTKVAGQLIFDYLMRSHDIYSQKKTNTNK